MSKKLYYLPLVLAPLALALPAVVLAGLDATAGLAQHEAAGFSPPGWVGGTLAALALILPIVVWFWMRRERES